MGTRLSPAERAGLLEAICADELEADGYTLTRSYRGQVTLAYHPMLGEKAQVRIQRSDGQLYCAGPIELNPERYRIYAKPKRTSHPSRNAKKKARQ